MPPADTKTPEDPVRSLGRLLDLIREIANIQTTVLAKALERLQGDKPAAAMTNEQLTALVNKRDVSTQCTTHLLAQCKWAFEQEEDRRRSIDAKAAALAALVSASLLLVVGKGFDVDAWDKLAKILPIRWAIALYGSALAALVAAAGCLLGAVMVRPFSGPSEQAVFNAAVLDDAERYERSLSVHFWVMQTANSGVNLTKVSWLKMAQWSYVVFLAIFAIMGVVFAISLWR